MKNNPDNVGKRFWKLKMFFFRRLRLSTTAVVFCTINNDFILCQSWTGAQACPMNSLNVSVSIQRSLCMCKYDLNTLPSLSGDLHCHLFQFSGAIFSARRYIIYSSFPSFCGIWRLTSPSLNDSLNILSWTTQPWLYHTSFLVAWRCRI